jgi:RNase_H superfamily
MTSQNVIILDIETSPCVVLVWEMGDQCVRPNQILKDWGIMAWSAKVLGKPESSIVYYDKRKGLSDRQILLPLRKILDWADIIITHNGKKFDSKKITAHFMIHGIPPPSPYKHIDTYSITKAAGAFTSHSLEYLAEVLKTKHQKLSHPKYPGLTLWKECLNFKVIEQPKKNPDAWEEMEKYNIHDVFTTEDVYNKVKPWGPKTMPKLYLVPLNCSICGHKAQRRGKELQGNVFVQRIHCQNPMCGRWRTEPLPKKQVKK